MTATGDYGGQITLAQTKQQTDHGNGAEVCCVCPYPGQGGSNSRSKKEGSVYMFS